MPLEEWKRRQLLKTRVAMAVLVVLITIWIYLLVN